LGGIDKPDRTPYNFASASASSRSTASLCATAQILARHAVIGFHELRVWGDGFHRWNRQTRESVHPCRASLIHLTN
ncbi:MAG: hypothetical protein M1546_22830, partial [Chloroflexi bacterium]|nr:hypothetical protein [Chloroflexota bacterium]